MNPDQCKFHRISLTKSYFCVTKIHNSSLLTLWQTWNCWRRKIKPNCDQSFLKLKITSKSGYTTLSASLMNEAVSIRVKQESTKTNVSRMRKKQTHPLTFSGFKRRIDWFDATSREIHQYSTSNWIQQWSV